MQEIEFQIFKSEFQDMKDFIKDMRLEVQFVNFVLDRLPFEEKYKLVEVSRRNIAEWHAQTATIDEAAFAKCCPEHEPPS